MAGVLKPSPGALRIIDDLEEGLAIVVNGNTAPKNIAAGQYLFIKNHSTLATGGYHATAAISSGGTISSSNVAADADGIANSLNSNKVNMAVFTKTSVTVPANGHLNVNDSFSVSGTVIAAVVLSTPNNAYIFGSASWSNTAVTIGLYNSATSDVSGSVVYGVIYR